MEHVFLLLLTDTCYHELWKVMGYPDVKDVILKRKMAFCIDQKLLSVFHTSGGCDSNLGTFKQLLIYGLSIPSMTNWQTSVINIRCHALWPLQMLSCMSMVWLCCRNIFPELFWHGMDVAMVMVSVGEQGASVMLSRSTVAHFFVNIMTVTNTCIASVDEPQSADILR